MTPNLFGGLPAASPARGMPAAAGLTGLDAAAAPLDGTGAEFALALNAAATSFGPWAEAIEPGLPAMDAAGLMALLPEGGPVDQGMLGLAPAVPTTTLAAVPGAMPHAMPSGTKGLMPNASTPVTPEGLLVPVASTPQAAMPSSATGPGWPPPGLSALFPEAAMGLAPEGEPLPPAPLGPRLPAAPLQADAAAPALVATAATPATAPLAEALARTPTALPIPERDAALAALDALDAGFEATPEVTPARGPEGLGGLTATTASNAPRLELAQAFPQPVPLGSPRFADELGVRLQWMAEQKGGDATLRIAPDGLGPVEIRLKLDGDRVDLGFAATQADTRQALEQALPKLREMLAQQGLQLGHADVGQGQAQHAKDGHADGASRAVGDEEASASVAVSGASASEASVVIRRDGRGVLDLYA